MAKNFISEAFESVRGNFTADRTGEVAQKYASGLINPSTITSLGELTGHRKLEQVGRDLDYSLSSAKGYYGFHRLPKWSPNQVAWLAREGYHFVQGPVKYREDFTNFRRPKSPDEMELFEKEAPETIWDTSKPSSYPESNDPSHLQMEDDTLYLSNSESPKDPEELPTGEEEITPIQEDDRLSEESTSKEKVVSQSDKINPNQMEYPDTPVETQDREGYTPVAELRFSDKDTAKVFEGNVPEASSPNWDTAVPALSEDLPFHGSKDLLATFDLDTQFYWDIALESAGDAPDNPYGRWIPATDYSVELDSISFRSIGMAPGMNIEVPNNLNKSVKFSVTVIENSVFSFQKYLEDYRNFMYQDGMIMPYKEAYSVITLYICDSTREVLVKKEFYAIPIISRSRQGVSIPSPFSLKLDFAVIGEDTEGLFQ